MDRPGVPDAGDRSGLYQVNVQLPAVFPSVPPCNPLSGLVSNLTINLLLGASYDAAAICVQPTQ